MFCAVAPFLPTRATTTTLLSAWLPALDGVVAKLEAGRARCRRRLRTWLVNSHDGQGVSEIPVRRLPIFILTRSARPRRTPGAMASPENAQFVVGLAKTTTASNSIS